MHAFLYQIQGFFIALTTGMRFDKKYGKTKCRTKNKDNQNESS